MCNVYLLILFSVSEFQLLLLYPPVYYSQEIISEHAAWSRCMAWCAFIVILGACSYRYNVECLVDSDQ
jgi:hypothetical protein